MNQIEIYQNKINRTLNKLNALNIYKQDFHIVHQWGVDPLENGLWLTLLAIEELEELLKYLKPCEEELKKEIMIRIKRENRFL